MKRKSTLGALMSGGLAFALILTTLTMTGCPTEGGTSNTVVDILSLDGKVTAPAKGAAPVTTVSATAQYTGSVAWKNSDDTAFTGESFAAGTVYKAVVT